MMPLYCSLSALTSKLRAIFVNKVHVYIVLFLTEQSGQNAWYNLTKYNVNVTYHMSAREREHSSITYLERSRTEINNCVYTI
jgi:hypothetical protein